MNTGNKPAVFYITDNGLVLAERLRGLYPDLKIFKFRSGMTAEIWNEYKSFIFIMATGIAVRTIAPLIKAKKTDPAVVVLDEKGKFSISLLSGHLGGANEIAEELAGFLGAEPVITTASDINGLTSMDLWARDNNLIIEDPGLLPKIAGRLINEGSLKIYSDIGIDLPGDFIKTDDPASADVFITNRNDLFNSGFPVGSGGESGQPYRKDCIYLRPGNLVVGIGCNSGTSMEEIEDAVKNALDENNLAFSSIHSIATIDIKAGEPGLIAFSGKYGLEINTFTPGELNSVKGISRSEAVFRATGANAVAEPAALLAAGSNALLVKKRKAGNTTLAIAEKRMRGTGKGRIFIVGTGPGSIGHITPYAMKALRESDVIAGYGTYLDLIRELIKDKEVVSTGMTRETERCRRAVELAATGRTVSVVSGGDPGIYAMAGLVLEIVKKQSEDSRTDIHIEVVPGISALNACASRLGAPLMHDFASISLSDRLTPWELIEKRLDAAAAADFAIVLYNPKSRGRTRQINRAVEIISRHRLPETPVGIVKGAMRENEKIIITDLGNMLEHDIDMQTTVIIGNSNTFSWNNLMITPRGYESKYSI